MISSNIVRYNIDTVIQAREAVKIAKEILIMEQERQKKEQNCVLDLGKSEKKDFFKKLVEVMRENFIATFEREKEDSLLIKFVGGQQFRLRVEQVFVGI